MWESNTENAPKPSMEVRRYFLDVPYHLLSAPSSLTVTSHPESSVIPIATSNFPALQSTSDRRDGWRGAARLRYAGMGDSDQCRICDIPTTKLRWVRLYLPETRTDCDSSVLLRASGPNALSRLGEKIRRRS